MGITEPLELLRAANHVVVWDYPTRDVPDSLTRAGLTVTIYDGPDESDVVSSALEEGEVVHRRVGRRPDSADLLYVHRPLSEIDDILTDAQRMGVHTIWRESSGAGTDDPDEAGWRSRVEAAGLAYLSEVAIGTVARQLDAAD